MSHSVNQKYLLLDTCIAEYCLNKYLQSSMTMQLAEWAGKDFKLAISEVTYSELIDGAYKDKIKEVKDLLATYTSIPVSQRILSGAGILSNIYKTYEQESKRDPRNMGLEDKIIGATSVIYKFPLVTANTPDFLHPFFTSISSKNLTYQKKNKNHLLTVDVLNPNLELLLYWRRKTK